MFLTALMLLVALCLSSVAAFYSIVGLTAIFAGAVVPIVIMGSILEVAKLVVTVWLHEYWRQCRWIMKLYLVPAVAVLMLLTSMGIFGFLSKAHLDQAVPTGDVAAQVALVDEKIRTERDNIEAARRSLAQMDAQVDQRLSRSDDEKGAERAVQIRRGQAQERQRLQADIAAAQKRIAAFNEERAPIASQLRKVEAEVGPIKYIAALIYGDNPDANLLERAVRWVIIVLVTVFDPLAVIMLLAATESWRWERERKQPTPPPASTQPTVTSPPEPTPPKAQPRITSPAWPGVPGTPVPDPLTAIPSTAPAEPQPQRMEETHDEDIEQELDLRVKEAMRLWKQANPDRTLKGERQRLRQGLITRLPWMDLADQLPREPHMSFGSGWPASPSRGDTWVRTDTRPHRTYKFSGDGWFELDKDLSDSYTYDQAYIDHLIAEMQAGRYNADMLTESEVQQIETRLKETRSV